MSTEYPATVMLAKDEDKKNFEALYGKVPEIVKKADYAELYGHTLDVSDDKYYNKPVAQAILFKYFKANDFKVDETVTQLTATLKWRKEFKPLKAAFGEKHDPKFNLIGYITNNPKSPANAKVITWNLYAAKSAEYKDPKVFFKNYEAFVRWRIGLMEQAIGLIDFLNPANNYIAQVHDYDGMSFLYSDSSIRKVGKGIVQIFQAHYPEFLSVKYFLNFPFILAWVYNSVIKNLFIPAETVKKFHILHSGKGLSKEFGAVGLPKAYGGDGENLKMQNVNVSTIEINPYAKDLLQQNFEQEAEEDVE